MQPRPPYDLPDSAAAQADTQAAQVMTPPAVWSAAAVTDGGAGTAQAPDRGGKVGRRALLAAAGMTLCCGSAALVPVGVQKLTQIAGDEAQQAMRNGEATVLNGLRTLEVDGEIVSLDAALGAAELARAAVQYIVLPVARVNSFVTGHALGGVLGAVDGARALLGRVGQDLGWLDNLHGVLSAWRGNINALPISLDKYTNADITSAEKYLTALKARVEQSRGASPQA